MGLGGTDGNRGKVTNRSRLNAQSKKEETVSRSTRNVRQLVMSLPTAVAVASAPGLVANGQDLPAYKDPSQPVETRVEDLLSRLTLEEKISLLHADSKFTTAAIPRLGIPRRWMSDGPHGVREDVGPDTWEPAGHTDDFSTYLPTLIGVERELIDFDVATFAGERVGV